MEMYFAYSVEEESYKRLPGEEGATHVMLAKEAYSDMLAKNELVTRINREMINAKRGITPKKERSGYIVRWCEQRILYCYAETMYARSRKTGKAWVYHVQTPISMLVSSEKAQEEAEEFLNKLFHHKQFYDSSKRSYNEFGYYFCTEVLMNISPYYEIWEISFTLPEYIPIPQDMLPPKRKKNNS